VSRNALPMRPRFGPQPKGRRAAVFYQSVFKIRTVTAPSSLPKEQGGEELMGLGGRERVFGDGVLNEKQMRHPACRA
jgi:hypothetical protein